MLSFLYFGLRRVFEFLILLGRSSDRKELELLVLRHELSVLRRQAKPPRYRTADRALLAALSRALPRARWSAFAVTPETLLRWHRIMLKRRWTYDRQAPGRPKLAAELATLILRLARENPRWGHRRIVGELKKLGLSVSETSVRNLLRRRGIPPAPQRGRLTWRAFGRQQAARLVACDVGIRACRTNATGPALARRPRLPDPQRGLAEASRKDSALLFSSARACPLARSPSRRDGRRYGPRGTSVAQLA